MSWGWTIGRDRIDAGYDLCVEPETTRYHGARFLVQVKGTVQKKHRADIVAPVSKARLRQYARNPHPVFLIRAAPDGRFYWLHVQEWAKIHRSRLSGSGEARIRMTPLRELGDRSEFENYLDSVLGPPSERRGALAALAQDRSNYLNTLDPRFRVRVNVRDGAEEHEMFALSADAKADVSFRPTPLPENLSRLNDALEFGLPRRIRVDDFQVSGSPLFDELGASRPHAGTLIIQAKERRGIVRIHPGREVLPFAPELELEAGLYVGGNGFAVSNDELDSVFKIDLRLRSRGGSEVDVDLTLGLRQSKLTEAPIQFLKELACAGEWAERIAAKQAMVIELAFQGTRARLSSAGSQTEKMEAWLSHVRLLSRLHLVAKTLNLDVVLPVDYRISEQDAHDIDFAYGLLKGQRLAGGSVSMEVEPGPSIDLGPTSHGLYATTNVVLSVAGIEIGAIPMAIDMPGYAFERIEGSTRFRVFHPEDGNAWFTYEPEATNDVFVRRRSDSDLPHLDNN